MTGREPWELVPPEDRIAIPEDEMRAILGLPAPPFNNGGIVGGMKLATTSTPQKVVPLADAAIAAWAAEDVQRVSDWAVEKDLQPFIKSINEMIRRLVGGEAPEDVDMRTPQERALPRPSSTPPMWAVDSRRNRR